MHTQDQQQARALVYFIPGPRMKVFNEPTPSQEQAWALLDFIPGLGIKQTVGQTAFLIVTIQLHDS